MEVMYEEDYRHIQGTVDKLHHDSNSKAVLLIDKNGQEIAAAGEIENLDTTSPELNLSCCKGTHFDKVTVELCRATGNKDPYMQYTMEDVLISSVSVGGGGGGLPTESVTFNYGKLIWNYFQTDHETGAPKGNVEKWWSCIDNKGG